MRPPGTTGPWYRKPYFLSYASGPQILPAGMRAPSKADSKATMVENEEKTVARAASEDAATEHRRANRKRLSAELLRLVAIRNQGISRAAKNLHI